MDTGEFAVWIGLRRCGHEWRERLQFVPPVIGARQNAFANANDFSKTTIGEGTRKTRGAREVGVRNTRRGFAKEL